MQDNGDYFYDVDGDGDLDAIPSSCYRCYGLKTGQELVSGKTWKQHVLVETVINTSSFSFVI